MSTEEETPVGPFEDDPLPDFSLLSTSLAKARPRTITRHVSRDTSIRGSVALFKAEVETLLTERHGLREDELAFLERIQATAIQPKKYSRENGLGVFLSNSDLRRFDAIRRRFVNARCCYLIRQSRQS